MIIHYRLNLVTGGDLAIFDDGQIDYFAGR